MTANHMSVICCADIYHMRSEPGPPYGDSDRLCGSLSDQVHRLQVFPVTWQVSFFFPVVFFIFELFFCVMFLCLSCFYRCSFLCSVVFTCTCFLCQSHFTYVLIFCIQVFIRLFIFVCIYMPFPPEHFDLSNMAWKRLSYGSSQK